MLNLTIPPQERFVQYFFFESVGGWWVGGGLLSQYLTQGFVAAERGPAGNLSATTSTLIAAGIQTTAKMRPTAVGAPGINLADRLFF